jgi:hypothetical protein
MGQPKNVQAINWWCGRMDSCPPKKSLGEMAWCRTASHSFVNYFSALGSWVNQGLDRGVLAPGAVATRQSDQRSQSYS